MLLPLAFLAGILTIFSPCVLPVLPFVFSQTTQPFRRSGLPMLVGMGLSFSIVGIVAAVGGGWIVRVNQAGRLAAIVILALMGMSLLLPSVLDFLTRPLVSVGGRLQNGAAHQSGFAASLVLGIATGLLWSPCAARSWV